MRPVSILTLTEAHRLQRSIGFNSIWLEEYCHSLMEQGTRYDYRGKTYIFKDIFMVFALNSALVKCINNVEGKDMLNDFSPTGRVGYPA
jgi:hypothetical protein